MSVASTSRTIKFIQKSGTYTAVIMSPSGDLFQEYEGTSGNITSVFPDYEANNPILYFVLTSSRVSEALVDPEYINYYFNGIKIDFSGNTSTGTFAGYFEKVFPETDQPYYGLKILKNLVELSGAASCVIKMVAGISSGTISDEIQATYTIPIQKSTGSSYRVTIVSGDNKNFVLRNPTESCILKAVVYQGGSELTAGLTYKWYKIQNGTWVAMTGKTSQTLTVAASDISTYGEFRVVVRSSGAELGADIQGVLDASDPYDIEPHPNPEDETIIEGGNESVTYTPVVVNRSTGAKAMESLFYFVVKDAVGNLYNQSESQTAKASCTVTYEQCKQAGGDLSVTITSDQENQQ